MSAAASCAAEMHTGERLRMALVRDRHRWLEGLCADTAGEIAHLGCADSPYTADLMGAGILLHERLVRVASVTGFDVDAPALGLVRARLPDQRFVTPDVTVAIPSEELGRYQLVIAGEVLEHVPDADSFLLGCGRLLAPGGDGCA